MRLTPFLLHPRSSGESRASLQLVSWLLARLKVAPRHGKWEGTGADRTQPGHRGAAGVTEAYRGVLAHRCV